MSMHPSLIPEKPLVAGPNGRTEKPQRIFFFERKDGSVFHAQEQEAWTIYSKGTQVIGFERDRPRLVGTGDGSIFQRAVSEAKAFASTDLRRSQEMIRKGVSDELEACRGNIVAPRDMDKVGNGVSELTGR